MKESTGGRPTTDHHIKIDMAKEISMIQRTEKGKQARQYFIQLEKMWNSPEMVMKRAYDYLNKRLDNMKTENIALNQQVIADKPKVLFASSVETSKSSVLIGELAKIIKQNGVDIGQKRLFDWLRNNSYLIKKKGEEYNNPTQKSMELGLFEIKKRTINNPDGSVRVTKTSLITGKGQIYFVNKFLKQKEQNLRSEKNGKVSQRN